MMSEPRKQGLSPAARAALDAAPADGPAVPEGREPASVVDELSDEELLATLNRAVADFPPRHPDAEALNAVEYPLALELRKARAAIAADRARRAATAPAGAVGEVAAWLRAYRDEEFGPLSDHPDASWISRAAALLEQPLLTPPAPAAGKLVAEWPAGVSRSYRAWEARRLCVNASLPLGSPEAKRLIRDARDGMPLQAVLDLLTIAPPRPTTTTTHTGEP